MKSFIKSNKKNIKNVLCVVSIVFSSFYILFINPITSYHVHNLYYDTIGTYLIKKDFSKNSQDFILNLEDKNPLCSNALRKISYQYKTLMDDQFYRYMYYGEDDRKDIKKLDNIEKNYISLNCPIEELLVVENIYNTALLKLYMD